MGHVVEVAHSGQEDASVGFAVPSESEPEYGQVCFGGVPLGEAVRFVDEHGTHVIRSLEFDVYGEGDTLPDAVHDFCEHADALFAYLAELTKAGEATEHEQQIAADLGQRLVQAYNSITKQLEARSITRAVLDAALRSRPRSQQRRLNWHPEIHRATSPALPV